MNDTQLLPADLAACQAIIVEQRQKISEQEQTIVEQDQKLSELEHTLVEQARAITELHHKVQEQELMINELLQRPTAIAASGTGKIPTR